MENKKPSIISDIKKLIGNKVYFMLRERTHTKQEIQDEFKLNERVVRDIISEIAKLRPIITPDKGYKVPLLNPSDGLEVIHELNDLDSRIRELGERKKPLWQYIESYMQKVGATTLDEFKRKLEQGSD
jgi:hypothetical protein